MAGVIGVDHVIVAVHDLPAAAALFSDVLGFHVSGGGSHPQFGTINRIIVLEDEYLELLASRPGEQPRGVVGGLLEGGEGSLAWIPSVGDPEAFAAEARGRGLQVDGPAAGRLEASEGFSRGWQTVTLPSTAIPGSPFVIRHDSTGDVRRRLLAGPVGLAPHRNGARRIAEITLAVADCRAAADRVGSYLDIDLGATVEGKNDMLAADCVTVKLPSGTSIALASPSEPGRGPISAALAERGEAVFAITFAVDRLTEVVAMLRGRGVGVRVHEPGGVLVAAQLNQRNTLGARIGLVGS